MASAAWKASACVVLKVRPFDSRFLRYSVLACPMSSRCFLAAALNQIEADMRFHGFINELSGNSLIGETTASHWPYLRWARCCATTRKCRKPSSGNMSLSSTPSLRATPRKRSRSAAIIFPGPQKSLCSGCRHKRRRPRKRCGNVALGVSGDWNSRRIFAQPQLRNRGLLDDSSSRVILCQVAAYARCTTPRSMRAREDDDE